MKLTSIELTGASAALAMSNSRDFPSRRDGQKGDAVVHTLPRHVPPDCPYASRQDLQPGNATLIFGQQSRK